MVYGTIAKTGLRGGVKFAKSPWGAGALGAGAGILGSWLYGGGKKDMPAAAAAASAPATATVSPPITYDQRMYDQSSTDYFRDSNVYDSAIDIDAKKDMSQTPSTVVSPDISQIPSADAEAKSSAGTDLVMLALIGGGALVVYGYVSGDK